MKKFIAIAIAVLTVCSFTTVAFAESTTTLTTTVPDAEYTLNIPADQTITYGAEETNIGNVTVTNSKGFAVGKNLEVTVTYDSFKCGDVATTIPFKLIKEKEGLYNWSSIEVLTGGSFVFEGQDDDTVTEKAIDEFSYTTSANTYYEDAEVDYINLKITSTDWGKALAGDYTATITFTAEVVAA